MHANINFDILYANPKNVGDMMGIESRVLNRLADSCNDAISHLSGFMGNVGLLSEPEGKFVLDIITACRDRCQWALDVQSWVESSDWCLNDDGWLCVFCSVARDLSFLSYRTEIYLASADADAGSLAARLMKNFHVQVACLERMGYLWLGCKGQPRLERSLFGYEISTLMHFGPQRSARTRVGRVSVEQMANRGMVLMRMAQMEHGDAGFRGRE
jgi:hypothetical protein